MLSKSELLLSGRWGIAKDWVAAVLEAMVPLW